MTKEKEIEEIKIMINNKIVQKYVKEEYDKGFLAGKSSREDEILEMINKNRKELPYILCYGLKKELCLTEEEMKQFEKIFIELYEKKLIQKIKQQEDKI